MASLGAATAGVLVAHFALPYLLVKRLNVGVLQRGSGEGPELALTFDDGPDPLTTPTVLDCLRRHGVRATFFLKGDAAEAHPDLVRRLLGEGHEVGSHSYRHRHAFLRGPLDAYRDTRRGVDALRRITGASPRFFRPPHGAYTWPVVLACRREAVQPVHWTIEAHDWHRDYTPAQVAERVLRQAAPGEIVLMHDGRPGGARTVIALEPVLEGLRRRGLRPGPLSSLPGLRTGWPGAPRGRRS